MAGYEDLTLGHVSARGSDDRTIYIKRKGVALGEVDARRRRRRRPRRRPRPRRRGDAPGDGAAHRGLQAPARRAQRRARPPALRDGVRRDRRRVRLPDPRQRAVRRRHLDLRRRARPDHERPPGRRGRARRSATGRALLLRNHGVLVAERDVQWAVLASVLLERAVRLQTIAASLGPLHPIPQRAAGRDPRASSTRPTSPASTGTPGCASCAAAGAPSACPGSVMAGA